MSQQDAAVAAAPAVAAAAVLEADAAVGAAIAGAVVPPVEAKKKFGGKRKAKGTPKAVKDPSAPAVKRTAPKKGPRPSGAKGAKSSVLTTVPRPVLNRILKTVPHCEEMRLSKGQGSAVVNRMMNRKKLLIVGAHKAMEARDRLMITTADIRAGGMEVYPHSIIYQPNNSVLVPLPPAIKAH